MKKLLLSTALLCATASSALAVTYGLTEASFAGFTQESFTNAQSNNPGTYNFGNGMVYADISGGALINYTNGYGMGSNPSISAGRDGSGDGYLGTNDTPASFSLNFASGIGMFGFSGAESAVQDGSYGRNGILDIKFYNLSNSLIGSFAIDTNGPHAWTQWHGFSSSEAIGSVVFDSVGHAVFDDVTFDARTSRVPDAASTLGLLGGVFAALVAFRRKLVA
jgi:hypothetical protein